MPELIADREKIYYNLVDIYNKVKSDKFINKSNKDELVYSLGYALDLMQGVFDIDDPNSNGKRGYRRNFSERINAVFASIEEAAAEKYPDLAGNGGKKVFLDKIDTWGSITAYLAGDSTENVIIANSKDKSMHKHQIPDNIGDGPELNEWAKSMAKKDYPDQMSAQSMQDKTLNEYKHKQSTLPNLARNQYQSAYNF